MDTKDTHYSTKNYRLYDNNGKQVVELEIEVNGETQQLRGERQWSRNSSAMLDALQLPIDVLSYEERGISSGCKCKSLGFG